MANQEKELERFLRREFSKNVEYVKIAIVHAAQGMKGTPVTTINMKERESIAVDDLQALADEIVGLIQLDADGMGGLQRYAILLYAKEDSAIKARFPIRVHADGEDAFGEGAGEEAATSKGLLAQLMRHNEAIMKTNVHAIQGVTQIMARQLEEANKRLEGMVEVAQKNQALLEEARSGQHERDMELLEHEAKEARKAQIFDKLSVLMPVVLNKLAGQKVVAVDDPSAMMIKSFSESLSTEQMQAIARNLKPEQMVLLAQIMKPGEEKKQLTP